MRDIIIRLNKPHEGFITGLVKVGRGKYEGRPMITESWEATEAWARAVAGVDQPAEENVTDVAPTGFNAFGEPV